MPLQLQQPVQVPFQKAYGPRPRGAPALHIVEDGQLTEIPGVKRRRKEVWEVVATLAASSGLLGGVVLRVDDLRPQLQMRRNPSWC